MPLLVVYSRSRRSEHDPPAIHKHQQNVERRKSGSFANPYAGISSTQKPEHHRCDGLAQDPGVYVCTSVHHASYRYPAAG